MERVLVIGNGFDLAHGLCTSYFDFLYGCCLITKRDFKGKVYKNGIKYDYLIKDYPIAKAVKEGLEKYKDIIENNCWINYFLDVIKDLEPTWIDLEREISEVCSMIQQVNNKEKKVLGYRFKGKPYNKKYFKSLNMGKDNYDLGRLKKDMQSLIKILDEYLKIASSNIEELYFKEIVDYNPSMIVNFNYTSTFQKIYAKNVHMEYVHGELSDNINSSSIVLGFDSTNSVSTDIVFAEFIKYYQMVKNRLEINIYNILDKELILCNGGFEERKVDYQLMVFGHSLDKSDSDILLPLINGARKVSIIYHSEASLSSGIKHLMEMIDDRERFIDMCFKNNNKISFVPQTKSIKDAERYAALQKIGDYLASDYEIKKEEDYLQILDYCSKDVLDLSAHSYMRLIGLIREYIKEEFQKYWIVKKEKYEKIAEVLINKNDNNNRFLADLAQVFASGRDDNLLVMYWDSRYNSWDRSQI